MIPLNLKKRLSEVLRTVFILRWFLRIVANLKAPRQPVGAVGVVFNDAGQVLLVEHMFRTDFPWGLPGGWVELGENPANTVCREIEEELKIQVQVMDLLFSEQVGLFPKSTHPHHLGLAYYCRLVSGEGAVTPEILSFEWIDPEQIKHDLAPFQHQAIVLGQQLLQRRHLVRTQ
jgi:ADP-ribose pyrophosphatase YjhB (NUDIX family)